MTNFYEFGGGNTLRIGINVHFGIDILAGKFSKNNKSTVWNNHTGGKISLQIHKRFGRKTSHIRLFLSLKMAF